MTYLEIEIAIIQKSIRFSSFLNVCWKYEQLDISRFRRLFIFFFIMDLSFSPRLQILHSDPIFIELKNGVKCSISR